MTLAPSRVRGSMAQPSFFCLPGVRVLNKGEFGEASDGIPRLRTAAIASKELHQLQHALVVKTHSFVTARRFRTCGKSDGKPA